MEKKIKVFLGGYVNYLNAQNINCRALSEHLDKSKFMVSTMLYPLQNANDFHELPEVKYFRVKRPVSLSNYLTYLRGLLWCDVAFLPKGEIYKYIQFVTHLLKKKTFITVEGLMNEDNYKTSLRNYGSAENVRQLYNGYDRTYSITRYMVKFNNEVLGIKSDGVLYLGVETENFHNTRINAVRSLSNIVFVGSNLKHKRIHEFLKLAEIFPELSFHIVGGDPSFAEELALLKLPNVTFHGRLAHDKLSKLLSGMDLHVFTSRSEGFPKVTLETAAAGVPSVVYGDYGADEWITTGKDGYVVDKFEEIVDVIKDLKSNPEKLRQLSANAVKMASRFDWKSVIKQWENAIEELYNSR